MVQVPLPQQPLRPSSNGFTPGRVIPQPNAVPGQTAALGRSLQGLGEDVTREAIIAQNLRDDAQQTRAYNLYDSTATDAVNRYRETVGAEAGEGKKQVEEAIAKAMQEAEAILDDDTQRNNFRKAANRREIELRNLVSRHYTVQNRHFLIGESQELRERSALNAVETFVQSGDQGGLEPGEQGPLPPTSYRSHKQTAMQAARIIAHHNGWPQDSEQAKALMLETTTAIHAGIVQRLVDDERTSEAREYLKGVPDDEVDSEVRRQLQGLVKRESVREDGAQLALRVRGELIREWRKRLVDPDRTGPMAPIPDADTILVDGSLEVQRRYEAGNISIEVRDAATAEIVRLANLRRNEQALAEHSARQAGEKWLSDNLLASVESMPATLYQQAQGLGVLDDLRAFAGSRRYVTQPEAYSQMLAEFESGAMRSVPWSTIYKRYRGSLSNQDLRHAEVLYRRANDVETQADFSFLTPKQALDDLAERLNVRKNPQRYDILRKNVEGRIREWEANNPGKKIGGAPDQLEKIMRAVEEDEALIPTGFIFDFLAPDPSRAVAIMTEEELVEAFREVDGRNIPVIPVAERQRIERELVRAGLELTPENIVRLWREAQRRGGRR